MSQDTVSHIDVRSLFRPLDEALISLLKSLSADDWNKQTVAKKWKVKDVATHLLDGNIRALSIQRDKYFGEAPPQINGYSDMVNWLNQLNADWVNATKRISPAVLIFLHEFTGKETSTYFESLDLFEEAIFPVDWAGESVSYNWMHLAREYTEKWHHQQQIREAVGKEGIMTKQFYFPLIDTYFRALPNTFKDTQAETGTLIKTTITSEIGGSWYLLKKEEKWELVSTADKEPDAKVELPAEVSWQLFSKNKRANEVINQIQLSGNIALAKQVLEMVSVMA